LEDINNLLNIGEIPNLFSLDDRESVVDEMKEKNAKNPKFKELTSIAVWEEFVG
jgi:P-loop containing dynein motor region D4